MDCESTTGDAVSKTANANETVNARIFAPIEYGSVRSGGKSANDRQVDFQSFVAKVEP
jgi:hypothetical protein